MKEQSGLDANVRYLNFFPTSEAALDSLPAAMAEWFRVHVGSPTPVQRGAWPLIRRGENVLLSASTGTGKTLAAFLPLFATLFAGFRGEALEGRGEAIPADARITTQDGIIGIVITPLKALAADQLRNLSPFVDQFGPGIRVGLRTGDTPASVRKKLKGEPPHILWTTPESLAVLLSQEVFRRQVTTLRWIVVDEVHAVASGKRGADLALSLERLELLAGSIQRIGLSATCEPLDEVARYLVGTQRSCTVVHVPVQQNFELAVEPLPIPTRAGVRPSYIPRLVERLVRELDNNRTTLVFANTRSLCERIGHALRRRLPARAEEIAIHHSSIAGNLRNNIEEDLKQGRLWAVISSASLELGIDIGSVDGVVFVHPPGGVARFLQRLGRAGHRPGMARRSLLLSSHPLELLEAAATAMSGRHNQIEPITIPRQPFDVLCQHLVGMALGEAWRAEQVFEMVRRAYSYCDVTMADLEGCLHYLKGRTSNGTSWLPARLNEIDEDRFSVTCRKTARLMRRNFGTIIAEEPRRVRVEGERPYHVGELDEPFADRLQPGDRFLLEGRCLTFRRRERGELVVSEANGLPAVPRWSSGPVRMPEDLARRLYFLRAEVGEAMREGPLSLARFFPRELGLGPVATRELTDFFRAQEAASEIPDCRTLLIEAVDRGFSVEYAVHTPLHAYGNEALARVVQRRMVRQFGGNATCSAFSLGVLLIHENASPLNEVAWREMLRFEGFDSELARALRASDLVRRQFAETATIGLMVLRQPLGGRRKVGGRHWVERRLFDQVLAADPEFVLLRQARHEALTRTCDALAAGKFIAALTNKTIKVRPLDDTSPFASAWTETGAEAAHQHWHEAIGSM